MFSYFQEMFAAALNGEVRGIWFWASLYALVVCAYSIWFQIRTRTWPSTRGQLIYVGAEKFGADSTTSEQEYVGKALYTYSVSGADYEGSRISPWVIVASHNVRFILEKQQSKIRMLPDGGVEVFYNPRNPKKSYLIVAGKLGMAVTIVAGTLLLITYWLKYHA